MRIKKKHTILAGVGAAVALGFAAPAMAGNLILTGHDDDFHCSYDPNACSQLGAMTNFARNGSSLPVLAIDNGTELSSSLAGLGIPYTSVAVSAVTASMFDHSLYSAFEVASVSTCGGCDNPTSTGTTLAAFSSAIASFYDAGGGILGLTSASGGNFDYVPQAAAGTPIGGSSGFVATAAGLSIPGFQAVNGDETHNIFTSYAGYTVAETSTNDGGAPVTIFVRNGAISCTGASCTLAPSTVPEPATLALVGVGLFGLGVVRRRKRS